MLRVSALVLASLAKIVVVARDTHVSSLVCDLGIRYTCQTIGGESQ